MSTLSTDVASWFTAPGRWSMQTPSGIGYRVAEHLGVATLATALALIIALPIALYLAHHRRAEATASAVVNLGRAIPSFGLIVLFWLFATYIPGLSPRFWPLVAALVALAVPPIFTNTYTAVREVDAAIVEAARGMGATERQVMLATELPLASPVIFAGLRLAYVQVIATTAIGAIVTNGGGLGRFIVDGFAIGTAGHPAVIGAAIVLGALTLAADRALHLIERVTIPRGVVSEPAIASVVTRSGAAG